MESLQLLPLPLKGEGWGGDEGPMILSNYLHSVLYPLTIKNKIGKIIVSIEKIVREVLEKIGGSFKYISFHDVVYIARVL